MKHHLRPLLFMTAILMFTFCTLCSTKAYAGDYYMGQYTNGNHAWLISESIQIGNYRNFEVTVKSVRNGEVRNYIHYVFSGGVGPDGYIERFNSSDGRSGEINASGLDQWSSVEHNIFDHYQKVWFDYIAGN